VRVDSFVIPASENLHTTGLMHRSKLECSAAAWGHSKSSGWWQIAPSPNYSQASLQCQGHTVIDPVRCLAVQPDAAPTD
jgi:hypothetical protein